MRYSRSEIPNTFVDDCFMAFLPQGYCCTKTTNSSPDDKNLHNNYAIFDVVKFDSPPADS